MAYFSIDVECVATSKSHNARAVAQLSLVDQYERVILNLYVKPELPVVSYLTPLTGCALPPSSDAANMGAFPRRLGSEQRPLTHTPCQCVSVLLQGS